MVEHRDVESPKQEEFRVEKKQLPAAKAGRFYRKLDETLNEMEFDGKVREACRPAYKVEEAGGRGRPGIDPALYFKMLMIGFSENLPGEPAITSRCEDSLSLRAFLGYDLTAPPDYSSLSGIRARPGVDVYHPALEIVLGGLYEHGLRKSRGLGINSSIIEANASLRELPHRNTEEAYREYGEKLATKAGIDPGDTKAVRRFDKKRKGRKTTDEVFGFGTPEQWAAKALFYLLWHWNRLVRAMGSAGKLISRFGPGIRPNVTLFDGIRPRPWCRG